MTISIADFGKSFESYLPAVLDVLNRVDHIKPDPKHVALWRAREKRLAALSPREQEAHALCVDNYNPNETVEEIW